MRKIIITLLTICLPVMLVAQTDTIEINRLSQKGEELTYKRGKAIQNANTLTSSQIRALFANTPEALSSYNSGKGLLTLANVVGFIGGFSIGWPIGGYLGSGGNLKPNVKKTYNILLISGCVEIGLTLLFEYLGNQKIKHSIELYNNKNQSNRTSYHLDFGFTRTGMGLSLRF